MATTKHASTDAAKPSKGKSPAVVRGINMSPESFEAMQAVADRLRMKQRDLISQVLTWFADQDDAVQQAVVGTLPREYRADARRRLLEQMAKTLEDAEEPGTITRVDLPHKPGKQGRM